MMYVGAFQFRVVYVSDRDRSLSHLAFQFSYTKNNWYKWMENIISECQSEGPYDSSLIDERRVCADN